MCKVAGIPPFHRSERRHRVSSPPLPLPCAVGARPGHGAVAADLQLDLHLAQLACRRPLPLLPLGRPPSGSPTRSACDAPRDGDIDIRGLSLPSASRPEGTAGGGQQASERTMAALAVGMARCSGILLILILSVGMASESALVGDR
ncbi:uncharacterized protein LOC119340667 [Triticum dicoccoides]|uniref:uncharacterized protein LOC119340667 n=1 Tax=Triticum dicoccoides TaxID=85692 RepID=UPI001890CFBB|nr:uncharacterized protein LOC119340667 [Triticum dicoccoides]